MKLYVTTCIYYSRFSFLINNVHIQFINYLVFDKSMVFYMHIIKTFYIFIIKYFKHKTKIVIKKNFQVAIFDIIFTLKIELNH